MASFAMHGLMALQYNGPTAWERGTMFDFVVVKLIVPVLTWMFGIGMAGCVIVIPWCAFKMFSVLFEKDQPDL
jgi:hypothetical protein